jgi:hypothetical protein
MRLIKIFGLAAIAAAAVMAFVGVTSASAVVELEEVVLCKILQEPCVGGNKLPAGTELVGLSTNALLLGSITDVSCTHSEATGKTNAALAHGEIEALDFLNCTEGGGHACTAQALRLNYLFKVELEAAHIEYEALVTAGPGGLRPEVKLTCPSIGIECKYGADSVLFEVLNNGGGGAEPMHMTWDVLQALTGLGFCFTSATWHAEYLVKCFGGVPVAQVGCLAAME